MRGTYFPLLLFLWVIFSTISHAAATDLLISNQSLTDKQTLVSNGEVFELGFFNPEKSTLTYLGIWYKKISPQTVVWVANRNEPIYNLFGVYLRLVNNSHLLLANESSDIWSSTPLKTPLNNPIVQLLDSGNLVCRELSDEKNYQWQSFDYPTNTLLPGMKLGWDSVTGLNRFLRSWKAHGDPGQGKFSFKLDLNGSPEVYLWKENEIKYRSGPWNGIQWSGVPEMSSPSPSGFHFTFVSNQYEKYYSYEVIDKSVVSRLVVHESGGLRRYTWTQNEQGWNIYWDAPKDPCDYYKSCGVYGICIEEDSPNCSCVKGLMPKNQKQWNLRNWKDGCVPKKELECGKDDGFLELKRMKLPDSNSSYVNDGMNLKECKRSCRNNCSCTAFANSNFIGESGCILWFGELVDLRNYANGGQNLYVRVAASQLGNYKKSVTIIITTIAVAAILLLGLGVYFMWKKKKTIMERTFKKKKKDKVSKVKSQELALFDAFLSDRRDHSTEKKNDDLELPLIAMEVVISTTDNFSDANKLGQGGFGCVYKGNLSDGQEIAVKRLSKGSGQGMEEFKNEVMLIARLQHRNLVRLLGCCIDGEEKMLVYEYMPNKSLDFILFDRTRSMLLDWKKRFNIIVGIARGLLYLHQDSRFRIIHRDLKASNVLLDAEMNPKISDFGMARVFGGDQTEANTNRIVGTYGYMSPEYAMDGLFSIKSDVFSYGVLLLEIISGQRNRGFYRSNDEVNLLGHAWQLWEEGMGLELLDASLGNSLCAHEAVRCIQVSLLCVQEHAEERPSMSSVLQMLNSETSTLPQPKQPGFSLIKAPAGTSSSSNIQESFASNQLTVTMLEAR